MKARYEERYERERARAPSRRADDETPREGCLHIVSTGVLPEARGRGLGRKQKEWQLEFARREGFHTIVTNMRRSNAQIIHLNGELGFEERKIHPNFYVDPQEDGIVMERHISLS
jgi:ribosomal protein S18 acetylase RimI-like enzyme